MKLNLLLYSYDWLPLVGGVQSVTADLAEGLSEWSSVHKGDVVSVTLITQTPRLGMDDSKLPFAVIRRPRLAELMNQVWSADVVHLANPALWPLALAWLLRKPTVIEHHGYQSICPNGLLLYGPDTSICPGHFMAGRYGKCYKCNSARMGRERTWLNIILNFPRRWLCKRATVNVAFSNHLARRLTLPRTRTIVHGIRITATGDEPSLNEDPPRIGYVGRLVTEKGIPVLPRKQQVKLRDEAPFSFHLAFIGDGAEQKKFFGTAGRASRAAENRTTFTGYLSGAQFEAAPARSVSVVVMPSQWEETAGLAVMEKMMRGGLVVVADIGGLSEVVGDAGLKFAPGDVETLYSQLRIVLEKPSIAATIRSAARARAVKHFNRDSMIQNHIALYREVFTH